MKMLSNVRQAVRSRATANPLPTNRRQLADVSNNNNNINNYKSNNNGKNAIDNHANVVEKPSGAEKRSNIPRIASNKNAQKMPEARVSAAAAAKTTTITTATQPEIRVSAVTKTTKTTTTTTRRKIEEVAVVEPTAYSVDSLAGFAVEDVDAADGGDPQLCAEYVKDIYDYLRELESRYAVRPDFLAAAPAAESPQGDDVDSRRSEITGKMRSILVDWLIQVHQRFDLLQETMYLTVSIMDRYLSLRFDDVTRENLQLVGVTCMWIASKYEEIYAPPIGDFVYITDDAYDERAMRQAELDILRTLDYNLGKPLPLHFLRRNSKAGGVDGLRHGLAKYFMETVLQEYSFAHVAPSQLAAAALCLSCRVVADGGAVNIKWQDKMVHYSGYEESQLEPLMSSIATFVVASKTSTRLTAVREKYSSPKLLSVAVSPLLDRPSFTAFVKSTTL